MRSRRFTAPVRPPEDTTPLHVDDLHHEISEPEERMCRDFGPWLEAQAQAAPFRPGEAVLVDSEGTPERTTRLSLLGRFRANGCREIARAISHLQVPAGHVTAVFLGDDVSVAAFRVDDVGRPAPPPNVEQEAAGQPWRRGRWIMPSSHVRPLKGGA